MTDYAEEKLAKAHPSDIEAATRYGWDKDDDHSPFNLMSEAFLAGCAHARKNHEHLIREARANEMEELVRLALIMEKQIGKPVEFHIGFFSDQAKLIREGKL